MTRHNNSQSDDLIRFETRITPGFRYPIVFTRDVVSEGNSALEEILPDDADQRGALLFVDQGLSDAQPGWAEAAGRRLSQAMSHTVVPILVPGGEASKNDWNVVNLVLDRLEQARLCRHGVVVAAGGGAVLDAVGFAAALFHRGVRLIRMPSTTLSQGDSGVGVKNGINRGDQKNLIGAFAPPWAVLCDLELLKTLDHSLVLDGIAECLKVAVIKDAAFFESLEKDADAIAQGEWEPVNRAVIQSARIHAEHIAGSGDPFEVGSSRPLDFGHWAAHRLESLSGYVIRHGEAVAIGIALDTIYAELVGMLSEADSQRIVGLTVRLFGQDRLTPPLLSSRNAEGRLNILEGLSQFREHLGGTLAITLPTGVGQAVEVDSIDESLVERAVEILTAN
jgi:3-dehydroquinate synthase